MSRDAPLLFTRAVERINKSIVEPTLEMCTNVSGEGSDGERLLVQAGRVQGLSEARRILLELLNEADRDSEDK